MLKLKLQYFGHLIWRANSMEKTLMLEKTEAKRSGQQRMRWLGNITDSMDTSWANSQRREAQGSLVRSVHGVTMSCTGLIDWTGEWVWPSGSTPDVLAKWPNLYMLWLAYMSDASYICTFCKWWLWTWISEWCIGCLDKCKYLVSADCSHYHQLSCIEVSLNSTWRQRMALPPLETTNPFSRYTSYMSL